MSANGIRNDVWISRGFITTRCRWLFRFALTFTHVFKRLTAFVLKCFNQAAEFLQLDAVVLSDIHQWVLTKQNSDGSFREDGERVRYVDHVRKYALHILPFRKMPLLENNCC